MSICTVEGCGRVIKARALCDMHLTRMYRSGEIGLATPIKHSIKVSGQPRVTEFLKTKCRAAGCEEDSIGMGFCKIHYKEFGFDKQRRRN